MDLHSLHHPTNTQNSHQEPSQAHPSACPVEQQLRAELQRQREIASEWKRELSKMERIANDALEKLEHKRQAKSAIKSEMLSWKSRYNDLAEAQIKVLKSRDVEKAEHKTMMDDLQGQHDEIKERLIAGGRAVRELAALKTVAPLQQQELADTRKKLTLAEQEAAACRKKLAAHEQHVAATHKKLVALEAERDRLRTTQSELAPTREKLRAAAKDSSDKAEKLAACVDMLMRAEQVLETCSQLHAKNPETASLSAALKETIRNMAAFRKSLECKSTAF